MEPPSVVPVWKPQGRTPLEVIQAYKKLHPQHHESITYAGRLDPMAEGVLLLVTGSEILRKKQYEQLSKTYEAEMLLGITTDSLDTLGLITGHNLQIKKKSEIQSALTQFTGKQHQKYPIYSSRTVHGKPLFWWARNNRISEIKIPGKTIEISSLEFVSTKNISVPHLYETVQKKIARVTGDFRQKEILEKWKNFAAANEKRDVVCITIRVSCSSGTYVRQLISDIGKTLGCGGCALSIVRTRVGNYTKKHCLPIE